MSDQVVGASPGEFDGFHYFSNVSTAAARVCRRMLGFACQRRVLLVGVGGWARVVRVGVGTVME